MNLLQLMLRPMSSNKCLAISGNSKGAYSLDYEHRGLNIIALFDWDSVFGNVRSRMSKTFV